MNRDGLWRPLAAITVNEILDKVRLHLEKGEVPFDELRKMLDMLLTHEQNYKSRETTFGTGSERESKSEDPETPKIVRLAKRLRRSFDP